MSTVMRMQEKWSWTSHNLLCSATARTWTLYMMGLMTFCFESVRLGHWLTNLLLFFFFTLSHCSVSGDGALVFSAEFRFRLLLTYLPNGDKHFITSDKVRNQIKGTFVFIISQLLMGYFSCWNQIKKIMYDFFFIDMNVWLFIRISCTSAINSFYSAQHCLKRFY